MRLADRRVLFGHQSVGADIVRALRDGVDTHGREKLRLVDPSSATTCDGSFFCQARIGVNGDPMGKTRAFGALVLGPLGEHLDLASHKYCYADIGAQTEVRPLFQAYRDQMARLTDARPKVRFVHVTVPLTAPKRGYGRLVGGLIGHPDGRMLANARREAFNDLLREFCDGRESLFDLAAVESAPDDRPGVNHPARFLRHDYTTDGGHLNARGSAHAARSLTESFAAALERDSNRCLKIGTA